MTAKDPNQYPDIETTERMSSNVRWNLANLIASAVQEGKLDGSNSVALADAIRASHSRENFEAALIAPDARSVPSPSQQEAIIAQVAQAVSDTMDSRRVRIINGETSGIEQSADVAIAIALMQRGLLSTVPLDAPALLQENSELTAKVLPLQEEVRNLNQFLDSLITQNDSLVAKLKELRESATN